MRWSELCDEQCPMKDMAVKRSRQVGLLGQKILRIFEFLEGDIVRRSDPYDLLELDLES